MAGRGDKGATPRFVVTSLKPEDYDARTLCEERDCARGDRERVAPGFALHRGLPARPLRRPHLGCQHAGQSAPPPSPMSYALPCVASPCHTPNSPGPPAPLSETNASKSARRSPVPSDAAASPWPPLAPTKKRSLSPTPGSALDRSPAALRPTAHHRGTGSDDRNADTHSPTVPCVTFFPTTRRLHSPEIPLNLTALVKHPG